MPKPPKTRIMVFGTFDILHKGHLHFFKQARALALRPFLIVSIARDINVKRIKGRLPELSQGQRLKAIKKLRLVDKVILGGLKKHIPHIIKQKPDIIALGYDQKAYVRHLKFALKKEGLSPQLVRLRPFWPKVYK